MPQVGSAGFIEVTSGKVTETGTLLLGLGANIAGPWGTPRETICRALAEIEGLGLVIFRVSHIFRTLPVGPQHQPSFLNAVVLAAGHMAPAALLRGLKTIERRAGRQPGARWGPRVLDIDVLGYGGRRLGWPGRGPRPGRLVLPHPELHKRAFVLVPLMEVAPHWVHPALGVGARRLLQRLSNAQRLRFGQKLDFGGFPCEKHSK
ncbi:MAG TPA: 2-amino-4-hydroxy-6-hydroxymethyldihydropteridine diphosphokinase [Hyphomicrobiaceae bacterium]|jgi:2-amino-4-hydroxy-6-hydroxymethyldihydropteridine diphosphokinase|nr:2-amino-4-hydroxy-6-hydroxymethyldihydropteridine diphosphokinase [Hyphomicrobiaceae bacterium]